MVVRQTTLFGLLPITNENVTGAVTVPGTGVRSRA
jgi:hypothetical protein